MPTEPAGWQAAGLALRSANHGSIGDSRPMALWGYARGPRVPSRPARELAEGSNKFRETHPRTHGLWRAGGDRGVQSRTVAPRLFGLRCQIMGVEPFSFLPQDPSEGGDLAC